MVAGVLVVSDGELAILVALDNALRAAGNEYVQESRMKRTSTFHVPQVTTWISVGVHVFDGCTRICERERFQVMR